MTLRLVPQPQSFIGTYQRLLDAIPAGSFWLKGQYVLPYSPKPFRFYLYSETPGIPVAVTIERINAGSTQNTDTFVSDENRVDVVTSSPSTTVDIQLMRGRNNITVSELAGLKRVFSIVVAATNYANFTEVYARELFTYAQSGLTSQSQAIYNPFSTRLVENLLPFAPLLPETSMINVMATRAVLRSLLKPNANSVSTITTALTQSTPHFHNPKANINLDTFTYPLTTQYEEFSGQEAHIWSHLLSLTRWISLLKAGDTLDHIDLLSVSQDIVKLDDGAQKVYLKFNDADQYSMNSIQYTSEQECFTHLRMRMRVESEVDLRLFAPAYTYDHNIEVLLSAGTHRWCWDRPPVPTWNTPTAPKELDSGCLSDFLHEDTGDFIPTNWLNSTSTGRSEEPTIPIYLDSFSMINDSFPLPYPNGHFVQEFGHSSSVIESRNEPLAQAEFEIAPEPLTHFGVKVYATHSFGNTLRGSNNFKFEDWSFILDTGERPAFDERFPSNFRWLDTSIMDEGSYLADLLGRPNGLEASHPVLSDVWDFYPLSGRSDNYHEPSLVEPPKPPHNDLLDSWRWDSPRQLDLGSWSDRYLHPTTIFPLPPALVPPPPQKFNTLDSCIAWHTFPPHHSFPDGAPVVSFDLNWCEPLVMAAPHAFGSVDIFQPWLPLV